MTITPMAGGDYDGGLDRVQLPPPGGSSLEAQTTGIVVPRSGIRTEPQRLVVYDVLEKRVVVKLLRLLRSW